MGALTDGLSQLNIAGQAGQQYFILETEIFLVHLHWEGDNIAIAFLEIKIFILLILGWANINIKTLDYKKIYSFTFKRQC